MCMGENRKCWLEVKLGKSSALASTKRPFRYANAPRWIEHPAALLHAVRLVDCAANCLALVASMRTPRADSTSVYC